MSNVTICSKDKCTGCSACLNVCHRNAISMSQDSYGFYYPMKDSCKCNNCGLCEKICPVNNALHINKPVKCYAAAAYDERTLLSSASGGIATIISSLIIKRGGVVYGCSGKDPYFVRHIRVEDINKLQDIKGSKYVQSYIGDTFAKIKKDLDNDIEVCFIGTPCQVAGLKKYLRQEYEKLICIDIVCHGVPSQKMVNDNLKKYCKPESQIEIAYRIKKHKNGPYKIKYGFKIENLDTGSNIFKPYHKDPYMFGFVKSLIFRDCCYQCQYSQKNRVGDITLCDYWGMRHDLGFDLGKGVSGVLTNTSKGITIFKEAACDLHILERNIDDLVRFNDQLRAAANRPKNHNMFKSLYPAVGFSKAVWISYFMDYLKDRVNTYYWDLRGIARYIYYNKFKSKSL